MPLGKHDDVGDPRSFVGLRLWVEQEVTAHVRAAIRDLGPLDQPVNVEDIGTGIKYRKLEDNVQDLREEQQRLTAELKQLRQHSSALEAAVASPPRHVLSRERHTPSPPPSRREQCSPAQFDPLRSVNLNLADQAKKVRKLENEVSALRNDISNLDTHGITNDECGQIHDEIASLRADVHVALTASRAATAASREMAGEVQAATQVAVQGMVRDAIREQFDLQRVELSAQVSDATRERAEFMQQVRSQWESQRAELLEFLEQEVRSSRAAVEPASQKPAHLDWGDRAVARAQSSAAGTPDRQRRQPSRASDSDLNGLAAAALAGRTLMEVAHGLNGAAHTSPYRESPSTTRSGRCSGAENILEPMPSEAPVESTATFPRGSLRTAHRAGASVMESAESEEEEPSQTDSAVVARPLAMAHQAGEAFMESAGIVQEPFFMHPVEASSGVQHTYRRLDEPVDDDDTDGAGEVLVFPAAVDMSQQRRSSGLAAAALAARTLMEEATQPTPLRPDTSSWGPRRIASTSALLGQTALEAHESAVPSRALANRRRSSLATAVLAGRSLLEQDGLDSATATPASPGTIASLRRKSALATAALAGRALAERDHRLFGDEANVHAYEVDE